MNELRIVHQFIELVQINSETTKEREIADYILDKMKDLDLEVLEDDSYKDTQHEAGNIIGKLTGKNENADKIYFTAHMDTVTPGNNIQPQQKDGYIMSDGSTILGADDKAGIAAIFETIHLLKEKDIEHGDIYFAIMSGEESGLVGSRHFDKKHLPVDYGYALDSDGTVGHIITSAPSQAKIYATITGKAAHAGVQPEKGVSAISITAKAITKMSLGRIDEETTANIGSFEGRGPTNVVCDEVLLVAEARSLSKAKLDTQVEMMTNALKETAEQMNGKAKVNVEYMYPAYHFSKEDKVVRNAMEAVTKIGRTPKLVKSGGGSDANHLSGKGIPTVNLAIGYENIHTKHEKMPIEELLKIPELMIEIIKQAIKK